jgi:hypothetical protein
MASYLVIVLLSAQASPSLDALIAQAEQRNFARAAAVDDEGAARLTLEWLRALERVVDAALSDPRRAASKHPWFRKQTDTLFYNELGGNWLISDQMVWKLRAKYRKTTAADDLAWLAAKLPKGGECEGYVPCYMATANMQAGEYLRLYPRGVHTSEAMREIIEAIERVEQMLRDYPKLLERSHCDDLMKQLAALEDAVQDATATERARTSETIHELASRCKP